MQFPTSLFSQHRWITLVGAVALLVTSACSPPAAQPASAASSADTTSRVTFVEPVDGAIVTSPFKVKLAAQNFVVENIEQGVRAGHGHLHIMVDADCIAVGNAIPKDDTHLHYGKGQLEAELTLAPGEHTLCLQAADGAHLALDGIGMTQVIKVKVQ